MSLLSPAFLGRAISAGGALLMVACASAPPAPAAAVVPFEQKMIWMRQLEDQRILALPEPPPPPPDPARKGRPAPTRPAASSRLDLATLAADAEPRVRRRAAVSIGRVGLKEGVPALTPLLADADAEVRQAAAFALGLIGDRAAAAQLLTLLGDPEPLVRGRAAEGLGLLAAAETDADAVKSLAAEAAPAVARMVADYLRAPAVVAMAADDERWPGAPEAEACKLGLFALVRLRAYEPLAAAVLDPAGRPISSWWPIAYALQRLADPRAVPALKQLLEVKGRYTPAFAARGLGLSKDASAAALLVPLIETTRQPREVVASAIRALGQLGGGQAGAKLAELAVDQQADGSLRIEAVQALAAMRAVEQVPYIQDLFTDEWPAMRAAALNAAAVIDPDAFVLVLSGLEKDRHWIGRAALAQALGTLPAEIAVERLNGMLGDEDRRVVPAVLRALVHLEAPQVATVLMAHLEEADFVIRETAAALVGEVKPAGGLKALGAAYEAGQADAAYGARAAAIAAMAAYGGEAAIAAVRPALADKDWAVRVRAVDLLATLEPTVDHRMAIRPAPGTPPAAYDDALLTAPPYSPHVFIETATGTIEVELTVLDAPQTARNFATLARKGFFNGVPVHRVVPNFVVQDGDPRGDGEGGPGYTIRDELHERPHLRGTVAMALSWRDTGGSQFYITHSPQPHLDGRYTVFGQVVNGMDVVDRMRSGDVIVRVRVWDGKSWE